MTNEERRLCDKLIASAKLVSDKDGEAYSECCLLLRGSFDPEVLRQMFKAFRDTGAGGLQYELLAACESFPYDTYITTFIEEGMGLFSRSPFWFRSMFIAVLTSGDFRDVTRNAIMSVSPDERRLYLDCIHDYHRKLLMSQDVSKYWIDTLEPKVAGAKQGAPLKKTGSV